jgi:hypothetical protein
MAMLLYKGNLITVACTRKKDQRLWESTVDAVGVMMADQLLDFLLRSPSKAMKKLKTSVSGWAKHGLTSTRTKHA